MSIINTLPEVSTLDRDKLFAKYKSKIIENPDLDRTLVSFQANRKLPFYGWFKYKEGFSAELVSYIIKNLTTSKGVLLDPFAGLGTALFAARRLGWDTMGIELLPVGFFAIEARLAGESIKPQRLKKELDKIENINWNDFFDISYKLKHISITEGAFTKKTERSLAGYRAYIDQSINNPNVKKLFHLAGLAILESISFTRKDGQYLRWDYRAGKSRSKTRFDKGNIAEFSPAIIQKLREIHEDLSGNRYVDQNLFDSQRKKNESGYLDLRRDSCLEALPSLSGNSVDLVITSPPYCNRYDYTRSYALELAYLGIGTEEIKSLRQTMLSCTVENKTKESNLRQFYESRKQANVFDLVQRVFTKQKALHEALDFLVELGSLGKLNNANIPKMVRNYFFEMAFVIYELSRILKPGGFFVMVNDNVRYAGQEIPVDLILSDFARKFGLKVKYIWTLSRGKGNSSQQMGIHGRSELRKCVYVWQKP